MPSSFAALVKLKCRAAASNTRMAARGGRSYAMMDQTALCTLIEVRLESRAFPSHIEARSIKGAACGLIGYNDTRNRMHRHRSAQFLERAAHVSARRIIASRAAGQARRQEPSRSPQA